MERFDVAGQPMPPAIHEFLSHDLTDIDQEQLPSLAGVRGIDDYLLAVGAETRVQVAPPLALVDLGRKKMSQRH